MRKLRRWLLLLLLVALAFGGRSALAQAPSVVDVYYVGPQDDILESILRAEPYLRLVDHPELADLYVLNNAGMERATLQTIGREVLREEVGLVVFAGPFLPQNTSEIRALLGVGTFEMALREDAPPRLVREGEGDPLQRFITWSSAPPIEARTVITNPNLFLPIVTTVQGEALVQRVRGREGVQVFIVGGWLSHASNSEWPIWPYFDYFIYRTLAEAGDAARVLSFAEYPQSPVPHSAVRLTLLSGGSAVFVLTLFLLFMVRRALFLRPYFFAVEPLPPSDDAGEVAQGWQRAGFQRPLAGLLFLLGGLVLLLVPLLVYNSYLLPEFLVPWSQVLEFWGQARSWLSILWLLFDAAIGVATVRYFAVLRRQNPREGLRYFQFYVWWQLLSGALQLSAVAVLSALLVPRTGLAHLSFYLVAHALIQFPGFLHVFQLFFRSLQRLDYEQGITLVLLGGPLLFQTLFVLLLRRWSGASPLIGESLGAVFGLGLGLYAAEWLAFAVGLVLLHRLGYSLRGLLLPTFDTRQAGRALGFGARLLFGSLAVPLGYFAESYLLRTPLVGYPVLSGGWGMSLLMLPYDVLVIGLYDALMPALATAHVFGYRTLTRYYASRGFHYGLWLSLFLLALLTGVGDYLVRGLASGSAAELLPLVAPLAIWGATRWLVWATSSVLVGLGRPAMRSWMLIGEQVVRLALIVGLVPRLGDWSLFIAYGLASLLAGVWGWYRVGRYGVSLHFSVWQTVVAPAGAALILYNVLRMVADLLWRPDLGGTLLFALVVLLLAIPLYAFLTALFGGWDDAGVEELTHATSLSGLGRPLGLLLLLGIRYGALLSPLHGQFSLTLYPWAEEEAQALSLRRTRP
ncbi:MAG: hypothetical protein ACLFU8_13815 [Anaerolineales bacterium]